MDGAGGDSIALNVTGLEKPTATKMSVSLYGLSLDQVGTLAHFFSLLTIDPQVNKGGRGPSSLELKYIPPPYFVPEQNVHKRITLF